DMAEARRLAQKAQKAELAEMSSYSQEALTVARRGAARARAGESSEAVRGGAEDLTGEVGAERRGGEKERRLLAGGPGSPGPRAGHPGPACGTSLPQRKVWRVAPGRRARSR